MVKKKKNKQPLVPLAGRPSTQPHESYNPLLEEDIRVNRRFSVGMVSSVLVNCLFFGGAAAIASKVTPVPPQDQLPPAQVTILDTKTEPTPTPTPPQEKPKPTPPPKVEREKPTPTPPPDKEKPQPTPTPEREKPTPTPEPEKIKPTPPPEKEKPTPPPPTPQVAMATPPPHLETPTPPPVKLDEPKQDTTVQSVVTPTKTEQKETAATQASRVAQVHTATTTALAPHFEAGSSSAVQAPVHHPITTPVGAHMTTMGPRTHALAEFTTPSSSGAAGGPVSVNTTKAAGTAGAGPALNARVAAATSASNDTSQISANTATAGNASVLDSRPTRSISAPLAMTGPRLARTKALTALGPTDHSTETYTQGGVVTAGQVVGTQGATSARGVQVASAAGTVEAQVTGVSNGVMTSGGSAVIRGPRVAPGSPGLSGPRGKTGVMIGSAYGQLGAPGGYNSANPGGGGVPGRGAGGGGGGSSMAGRVGGGVGNGGSGSDLGAQSSGTDAVVSARKGTPNNGPIAQDGAAFGPTGPKSKRISTTSVGDLSGPDGPAGDVNGTRNGMGIAGQSTGKSTAVSGNATGSVGGFKEGTGTQTVEGTTGGRKEGARSDGAGGPTTTGDKIGKSENAKPLRQVQPEIPDDLRTQQFQTSVTASVTVHTDGSSSVELTQGSGNAQIDKLVLAAMRKWKWQPAVANNVKVEQTLPYRFDFQVK